MPKTNPLLRGFPFSVPRSGQAQVIPEAIRQLTVGNKPVQIIQAPTGSGKSAIAMAIARYLVETVMVRASPEVIKYGYRGKGSPYSLYDYNWRCFNAQEKVFQHSAIGNVKLQNLVRKALIVTPQKALQDQYYEEFKHLGVSTFKGKANYKCRYSCSNDRCAQCIKKYRSEVHKVLYGSSIVVCNYYSLVPFLLQWENALKTERASPLLATLIIDEAHLFPQYLRNQMTVKICPEQARKDLKTMDSPEYGGITVGNKNLAKKYIRAFEESACKLRESPLEDLDTHREVIGNAINLAQAMTGIAQDLGTDLYHKYRNSWIVLRDYDHDMCRLLAGAMYEDRFHWYAQLDAVETREIEENKANKALDDDLFGDLTDMVDGLLGDTPSFDNELIVKNSVIAPYALTVTCKSPAPGYRHWVAEKFDSVVCMSGTIDAETYVSEHKIDPADVHSHVIRVTAPAARRPFILMGDDASNMKWANKDNALPVIAKRILAIAKHHPEWQGIVHTHSKWNGKTLQKEIRKICARLPREEGNALYERFIWHTDGPKHRHVREFLTDPDESNRILVSHSVAEGFDGKDRIARWQCIVKVPYLPTKSAEVKARMKEKDGDEWYLLQTAEAVAQMYGRVHRHDKDFGITYMLDGGWKGFSWRLGKMDVWDRVAPMLSDGAYHSKSFRIHETGPGVFDVIPRHTKENAKGTPHKPLDFIRKMEKQVG